MSRWTHRLCRTCYAARRPGREPHIIKDMVDGFCCACAGPAPGLWYRDAPGEQYLYCTLAHGEDDDAA